MVDVAWPSGIVVDSRFVAVGSELISLPCRLPTWYNRMLKGWEVELRGCGKVGVAALKVNGCVLAGVAAVRY